MLYLSLKLRDIVSWCFFLLRIFSCFHFCLFTAQSLECILHDQRALNPFKVSEITFVCKQKNTTYFDWGMVALFNNAGVYSQILDCVYAFALECVRECASFLYINHHCGFLCVSCVCILFVIILYIYIYKTYHH